VCGGREGRGVRWNGGEKTVGERGAKLERERDSWKEMKDRGQEKARAGESNDGECGGERGRDRESGRERGRGRVRGREWKNVHSYV